MMANLTACSIDQFRVADDKTKENDINAASNYRQIYANDIVLILRGECTFSSKVYNAQLLGAIGVIIGDYNTSNGEEWIVMSKDNDGHDIEIPAMFVPHNTYSWIHQLLLSYSSATDDTHESYADSQRMITTTELAAVDTTEPAAVYAMLDGDGEYVEANNSFWLAAFGIVIIVIPTLWCFIVCMALLRKKIISYVQRSRRRKHLNTIPVILYKGSSDGAVPANTEETASAGSSIFGVSSNKLPAMESTIGIGLSIASKTRSTKGELTEGILTSYAKLEEKAHGEEQDDALKEEKQTEQLKQDETGCNKKILMEQDALCCGNEKAMKKKESGNHKLTSSLFAGKHFPMMSRFLLNPFRAKQEEYTAPHNDSCAICLDDFQMNEQLRLLPCKHGFHIHCIDPWLSKSSELCPMCKQSIFMSTHNEDDQDEEEAAAENHGCLHSLSKICCISQRAASNNQQQQNDENDSNEAGNHGQMSRLRIPSFASRSNDRHDDEHDDDEDDGGNVAMLHAQQSAENESGVIVLASRDELVAIESDSNHSEDAGR